MKVDAEELYLRILRDLKDRGIAVPDEADEKLAEACQDIANEPENS